MGSKVQLSSREAVDFGIVSINCSQIEATGVFILEKLFTGTSYQKQVAEYQSTLSDKSMRLTGNSSLVTCNRIWESKIWNMRRTDKRYNF